MTFAIDDDQLPPIVPIYQLGPSLDASSSAFQGTVCLIWPYSKSKQSLSLLVRENDPKLREKRSQVRVNLNGYSANTASEAQLNVGDEVRVYLRGAKWLEAQTVNQTPGKSISWDLRFSRQLLLKIYRNSEKPLTINIDRQTPTPEPVVSSPVRPGLDNHANTPTPPSPDSVGGGSAWTTPGLLRTQRLSNEFTSSITDSGDDFEHPLRQKKFKLGYRTHQWRFSQRTPSPQDDVEAVDDLAVEGVASRPHTPNDEKSAQLSRDEARKVTPTEPLPVVVSPVESSPPVALESKVGLFSNAMTENKAQHPATQDGLAETPTSGFFNLVSSDSANRVPEFGANVAGLDNPEFVLPELSSPFNAESHFSFPQLSPTYWPQNTAEVGLPDAPASSNIESAIGVSHDEQTYSTIEPFGLPQEGLDGHQQLKVEHHELDASEEKLPPPPAKSAIDYHTLPASKSKGSVTSNESLEQLIEHVEPSSLTRNTQEPDEEAIALRLSATLEESDEPASEDHRPVATAGTTVPGIIEISEEESEDDELKSLEHLSEDDGRSSDYSQEEDDFIESASMPSRREDVDAAEAVGSSESADDEEEVDAASSVGKRISVPAPATSEESTSAQSRKTPFDTVLSTTKQLNAETEDQPAPPVQYESTLPALITPAASTLREASPDFLQSQLEPAHASQPKAAQSSPVWRPETPGTSQMDGTSISRLRQDSVENAETKDPEETTDVAPSEANDTKRVLEPALTPDRESSVEQSPVSHLDEPKRELRTGTKAAESASKSEVDAEPQTGIESTAKGFRTPLSYFVSLVAISEHFNSLVDVIATVASTTRPTRARKGPRDFNMTMYLSDPSLESSTPSLIRAQLFRPARNALPKAETGDAVLLRNFKVQMNEKQATLLSSETGAWAVFGKDSKGAYEASGPPVELGKEEQAFAVDLHSWWEELSNDFKDEIEDDVSQDKRPGKVTADPSSSTRKTRSQRTVTDKAGKADTTHELRNGVKYTDD